MLTTTTGADSRLRSLVAAQEAEVMARYGVDDPGPGPAPDTPCLLARLDGRPVGCVALGRLTGAIGEVERMYVDPAARGRSTGRLLLQAVEDLAVAHGYRALRLETGTQQPEAPALYDSAGWSRIDCYGYSKDDPTTICYEKQLPPRAGRTPAAERLTD